MGGGCACSFLQETYTAVRGQGAWLNSEPIQVSQRNDLRNAVVATGFPYDKATLPILIKQLQTVLSRCQDVRRNGSAALDLCAVARGQMDAYYESVKPWDMAAGVILIQEAGGQVSDFAGGDNYLFGKNIIVGNPAIFIVFNFLNDMWVVTNHKISPAINTQPCKLDLVGAGSLA